MQEAVVVVDAAFVAVYDDHWEIESVLVVGRIFLIGWMI